MWARSICALFLVLATTGARADSRPSLLDLAPDDTHLVAYVRNLDSALTSLDDLRATLRAVGLQDEGFRWLSEQSKKELGVDLLDKSALTAAGIDLSRGFAFYRIPQNPYDPVVAIGVANEGALVDTVAELAERAERQKFKAKKKKQGSTTIHSFTGENGYGGFMVCVRDGVAFLGSNDQALAFVVNGAFSQRGLSSRFPDEGASVDVGVWVDFAGAAADTNDSDLRSFGTMGVSELWARYQILDDRISLAANATLQPMVSGFLKHLAPRYSDESRQTAALRSLPATTSTVMRLLVPTDGITALLEQTGALSPEVRADLTRELGFDIKDDVLDVFLGDMTLIVPQGLSDLRLELSVQDAGKAQKLISTLLQKANAARGVGVRTEERDVSGITVHETVVTFDDRDAYIAPRFYWTFQGGRLVAGLTERAVTVSASKQDSGFVGGLTNALARDRLLTPSTFASFGRVDDYLLSLHDVMAVVRNMLRGDALPATDLFDVPVLLLDRMVDSAVVLDIDAKKVALVAEATMLQLAPGASDATAAGAYTAALVRLYTGNVEQATRDLVEVARRFPDTPYGQKADRAVFSGSSILSLYALAAPVMGAGMFFALRAPSYSDEAVTMAAPKAVAAPADPCVAWARDVCYYTGPESKECKKAEKILAKPDKKFSKKEQSQCALELYKMRGY